ncbi:MAG: hypothetical protein JXR70_12920 [Spirochaetales bacterium]|nr:hypothetical protein [Spirochaetales bacterium]
MAADTLLRARQFFQNGKYKETIRILESEIFNFRDNFNFYFLLGSSCLYSGDISGASTYLDRAHQIDPDHINTRIGQAAIFIYKQEMEQALKIYLDILEMEPQNKRALTAIKLIKKYTGNEDYVKYFNAKQISRLLPAQKKSFPWGILLTASSLVILGLIIVFTYNFPKNVQRLEKDRFLLPNERPELIQLEGDFAFQLTEKEVKDSFNLAKLYFNEYKDNLARIEINRLLNSNATNDVKNIARMLLDQLEAPSFSNYTDNISVLDFKNYPLLYDGCYVIWKGRIGEIKLGEQNIHFDLWVGDGNQFQGVVKVVLNFGEKLKNGDWLEVLGQARMDTENNIINLAGQQIHILPMEK